jgi:hypothetical protein
VMVLPHNIEEYTTSTRDLKKSRPLSETLQNILKHKLCEPARKQHAN